MVNIKEAAKYIEVIAEVRYWEDATVNGKEDHDGAMIPMREGNSWRPTISLSDGQVIGWPEGVIADIHYKVCDQGQYWLLGEDMFLRLAKWKDDYVPGDFLCHGDSGWGYYIIFKVGADGFVEGWKSPEIKTEQWDVIEQLQNEKTVPVAGNLELVESWYHGGALMLSRHIPGITQVIDVDSAKYYGGENFVCETISISAARMISRAMGWKFIEGKE